MEKFTNPKPLDRPEFLSYKILTETKTEHKHDCQVRIESQNKNMI